jgi:hypothetical protein
MTELPQTPAPRCKFLYCKSMVVYGEDFENDPDYQAGTTDFWCLQTSKAIGPDEEEVNMEECCRPERPCYREY